MHPRCVSCYMLIVVHPCREILCPSICLNWRLLTPAEQLVSQARADGPVSQPPDSYSGLPASHVAIETTFPSLLLPI